MKKSENWVKYPAAIHLCQYNTSDNGKTKKLSYDLGYTTDYDFVNNLNAWAKEMNNRFPDIKVWITGPGKRIVTDDTIADAFGELVGEDV